MEFILENENLRVTVESHGAELVSVVNKQTGAEMLWQADPAVWARHAPVLFPYCGRLKDGAFTCKGVRYEGGQCHPVPGSQCPDHEEVPLRVPVHHHVHA